MMFSVKKSSGDKLTALIAEEGKLIDASEKSKSFEFDLGVAVRFLRLHREHQRAISTHRLLPRSLIVLLICQYDAYLGRLVRLLLLSRPEALKSSERKLEVAEVLSFNSLEELRDRALAKEIETLLRLSHADQFKWLEKKFKVELRKELPVWPTFIEVTERRDLFAQGNGFG